METIERYGARAPRKKKHGALTAILVILLVLLAAVGVVSWLAFSDPYAGRGLENAVPSEAIPQTLAKSVFTGKECDFSTDEVNGYLAYLFRKNKTDASKGGLQPQAVAVAGASGDSANLYIPVTYGGKRFGVSLNVIPSLDVSAGRLLFRVNSVHVGRLPVPVGWTLKKAEGRLPKGFSRDGNTVFCAAPALKLAMPGVVSASAKLTEFRLENGMLTLAAKGKIMVG